jgi:hypothetical protein
MTTLEEAMRDAARDTEAHEQSYAMKQLRDYLAGALCCQCGEPLGHDEEIVSDDEDRTVHKHCEDADDDDEVIETDEVAAARRELNGEPPEEDDDDDDEGPL